MMKILISVLSLKKHTILSTMLKKRVGRFWFIALKGEAGVLQ